MKRNLAVHRTLRKFGVQTMTPNRFVQADAVKRCMFPVEVGFDAKHLTAGASWACGSLTKGMIA